VTQQKRLGIMATRPPHLKAKPMAGRWQAGFRKQSFWLDIPLIVLSFWISFRGKWETRGKKT